MKSVIIGFLSLAMAAPAAVAGDIDFSKGILWVNEDWYGHQNSTVNYMLPDDAEGEYWHYRVVQEANPGRELGCTAQFGAVWDDRFYIIAKQEKDPGASVTGGRLTVCDASTMEILHQSALIDPSGAQCDGRGFVGVDAHKGYISTSNGVWVLDLDTYTISGPIEGTGNTTGSLYHSQCGSMVQASGRVFIAHQLAGLIVVDAATDRVERTIPMDIAAEGAGIGSVVKAKDGSIWLSVAGDTNGMGSSRAQLVRVDPVSLDTEVIELPQDIYGPANSWYAWTPDTFCASSVTNSLYWCGGTNSWFTGYYVFRYDIADGTVSRIIDLKADGENWKVYGCSLRVHPITDEIYASLYHEVNIPTYIVRRYDAQGKAIRDYDMISNYWFPSLPVFPADEANRSGVEAVGIERQAPILSAAAGCITARGLNAGQPVEVYTASGSLTACAEADAEGCATLPVPPGLYIARAGGIAKTIIVR